MIKGFVFDLDDTLYLERDYVRSGFCAIAQAFGDERLSDELMRRQLDFVGEKMATGEIEGIILCSNCIADLGLSAVDITREWIGQLD